MHCILVRLMAPLYLVAMLLDWIWATFVVNGDVDE